MECPSGIRLCPAGWSDCEHCKYVGLDDTCLYVKSDIEIVILAAEIAEEVVIEDAIESAHTIRGTWMQELNRVANTAEFWTWFYKGKRPGDINYKEPLNGGASEPGGGSKNRTPPKPPYKMPEYLKNWGQEEKT